MHVRLEQECEESRSSGGVIGEFRLFSGPRGIVGAKRRVRTDFALGMRRARRSRILAGFACAVILAGAGCHKQVEPQGTVAIEYSISPQPVRVGPVVLSVKLRDAAGKPVEGARVGLEADMSHPGMAPVFGEARESAPGQYQGSLQFGMPGDWVVLIHATLRDGRKLEREASVPGVTEN
jgi:hypothetical protein